MMLAITVMYAVLATALSAPLDVNVARVVGGGGTSTTVANAISVLSSGNIVISGSTNGNVATARIGALDGLVQVFTSSGGVAWTKQVGSSGAANSNSLEFVGSAIDSSSNIYVAGRCVGTFYATAAGGNDVCVIKYDSAGNVLYNVQNGGTSEDISYGTAVGQAHGFLYVVGTTNSATWNGKAQIGEYDGFLLKLSLSNLAFVDVYRFGDTSAAKQQTQFYAVAVDSTGYMWVAGFTKAGTYQGQTNVGSAGGADFLIQKMRPDGTVVYARLVGGADHELAYAIALDTVSSSYTTGVAFSNFDEITGLAGQNVPVVKYNNDGVKQWSKLFGGTGNDFGRGVAYDTILNTVVVTGYTNSPTFQGATNPCTTGLGSSFVLVLNPSDGSVIDVRLYPTTSSSSASGSYAVATDAANIYLGGITNGAIEGQTLSGNAGALMLKLNRFNTATPTFKPTLAPTFTVTRAPTVTPPFCEVGWGRLGNKCYKTTGIPTMNFDACRDYCAAQHSGAGMLCIENASQNAYIAATMPAGSLTWTWIGLTDKVTEGDYWWGTGCFSTYNNWGGDQPNGPDMPAEDWVAMTAGGAWHDVANTERYCACEYLGASTCPVTGARRLEATEAAEPVAHSKLRGYSSE